MMTNEQVAILVNDYFKKEGYSFPQDFEHRVDPDSSAVIYSFIRHYKPTTALQIGTWEGGTTCIIAAALKKNKLPYTFVASELLDDKRQFTKEHVYRQTRTKPTLIGDITKNLDLVPKEIDFLFHDTDHDKDTTLWVLDNIFPRIKKGGLVIFHDWAVTEVDGKWVGKGENGAGGWPETQVLMDLHNSGNLPLEKVYWNYKNPGFWETGVFLKT